MLQILTAYLSKGGNMLIIIININSLKMRKITVIRYDIKTFQSETEINQLKLL